MFGGGIYLTTHDMEDYIGKYRDKVPPISEFVPADQQNKGPIDVASLQKKADDFIDEGMDNVKAVVNKVITIVIATGVVMASVGEELDSLARLRIRSIAWINSLNMLQQEEYLRPDLLDRPHHYNHSFHRPYGFYCRRNQA